MSKQPTIKSKILDMKDKLRIIEAFDEKVKTEGKVNKAQFAVQYGLSKSSFGSILNQRQSLKDATEVGKTVEGRKKSRKDPMTK